MIVRNIRGSKLRTLGVIVTTSILVSLFFSTLVLAIAVTQNAELGSARLGADMLLLPPALPSDSQPSFRSASDPIFIVGPSQVYMNRSTLVELSTLSGVESVSPQLYLATQKSSRADIPYYLVAFDPDTDFVVRPWSSFNESNLGLGEAIAGARTNFAVGDTLGWNNHTLKVVNVIGPTNSSLDETVLVSLQTAYSFDQTASFNNPTCIRVLVCQGLVSGFLIRLSPGVDPHNLETPIKDLIRAFTLVERSGLISQTRIDNTGITSYELTVESIMVVAFVVLATCTYSMILNERKPLLGLMRSLGATARFLVKIIILETSIISFIGGLIGLAIGQTLLYFTQIYLAESFKISFLEPSFPELVALSGASLILGLGMGAAASAYPTYIASHLDPYEAIRKGE